ncbi:hypothetical protein ACVBEQ_11305 [Nakamurella sp. GG22]
MGGHQAGSRPGSGLERQTSIVGEPAAGHTYALVARAGQQGGRRRRIDPLEDRHCHGGARRAGARDRGHSCLGGAEHCEQGEHHHDGHRCADTVPDLLSPWLGHWTALLISERNWFSMMK